MSFSSFFEKISTSKKVAGLYCCLNNEDEYIFNVVVIYFQSKKLNIVQNKTCKIDELQSYCKGIPVLLAVDGKGILHKKTRSFDQALAIESVFPGANENQFYWQEYTALANEKFISICRKEQINKIVFDLNKNSISPFRIMLGPFSLGLLDDTAEICSANQIYKFSTGRIIDIAKSDSTATQILVEKETIVGNEIIAYTSALEYFNPISGISTSIDNTSLMKEFVKKIKIKYLLISSLFFILIILICNTILYERYRAQYEQLDMELKASAASGVKLQELKNELLLKQELLKKSGLLEKSKISFYMDRIINCMPSKIKLRNFEFQPVIGKVKDKEEINYDNGKIIVKGVASSGEPVSNWIKELEKLAEIKEISLENFEQEEFNIPGEFELTLIMNSDAK